MLKRINFKEWNQFSSIDIKFDKQVTVITGANGSGKSSLLRIISKIIGWDYSEIAKPKDDKLKSFLAGPKYKVTDSELDYFIDEVSKRINKSTNEHPFGDDFLNIGKLTTDKNSYNISVPKESDEASYQLHLYTSEDTEYLDGNEDFGINIPSHRMPYFYNELELINSKMLRKIDFYNAYKEELMKRQVTGEHYDSTGSPHVNLKSSLITAAIYGEGNQYITKDETSRGIFKDFIKLLKIMLPVSLKFETLKIEEGEIIFVTESGDFLLDAVSGGIGSVIDLTWQIFMALPEEDTSFFVLIDEIENHLHPSMQRSILPKLIDAFPSVQFIVTTHSPFIVNSIQNSTIIALDYNEENKIISQELNFNEKHSSAMEVLRDILGVPVTMPIWAENKIDEIVEKYTGKLPSYEKLKKEMAQLGLDNFMPYTLERLSKGFKND